jgi:hypothetical protein
MTAQQDTEIVPFSKFIGALDPWLDQVVLIGGWAHRLYRLDSRARNLEYLPLTTLDGDVAVPTKLKVEESNVRSACWKQASRKNSSVKTSLRRLTITTEKMAAFTLSFWPLS